MLVTLLSDLIRLLDFMTQNNTITIKTSQKDSASLENKITASCQAVSPVINLNRLKLMLRTASESEWAGNFQLPATSLNVIMLLLQAKVWWDELDGVNRVIEINWYAPRQRVL